MTQHVNIILAIDKNNGIGKKNKIPWRVKRDMKYFKDMTTNTIDPNKKNVVIMGRKSWESLPLNYRPLPGRINIIISQNTNYFSDLQPDVYLCTSYDSAIIKAQSLDNIETIWICGGSQIYEIAFSSIWNKLYMTVIDGIYECDVFLKIPTDIKLISSKDETEDNINMKFEIYERN